MAGRGLLVLVAPTRTGSGRRPSPRAPSLFGRPSRSRPLLADELHPGGATRLNGRRVQPSVVRRGVKVTAVSAKGRGAP
jgi:hypothetical protein